MAADPERWPELPYAAWADTAATLQLWTQIVGKIRLVQTPWVNHSWHVVYYVTARGLSTRPLTHGDRTFTMAFDFIDHRLTVAASDGTTRRSGMSVCAETWARPSTTPKAAASRARVRGDIVRLPSMDCLPAHERFAAPSSAIEQRLT